MKKNISQCMIVKNEERILARCLDSVKDLVDEIVIVTREDLMLPIGDLCRREGMHKVTRIVKGGASRTESVLEGLHAADPKADLVAIHDGARPFLPPEVLEHTIETARTRTASSKPRRTAPPSLPSRPPRFLRSASSKGPWPTPWRRGRSSPTTAPPWSASAFPSASPRAARIT